MAHPGSLYRRCGSVSGQRAGRITTTSSIFSSRFRIRGNRVYIWGKGGGKKGRASRYALNKRRVLIKETNDHRRLFVTIGEKSLLYIVSISYHCLYHSIDSFDWILRPDDLDYLDIKENEFTLHLRIYNFIFSQFLYNFFDIKCNEY